MSAHIDGDEQSPGPEPTSQRRLAVGIDTEVFELLSVERGQDRLADRPRIDRWLGCWAER